ncbi:MAG: ion channel [Halieaceae bacterium]|nr:ion channel [Halieaceae bacterium]
MLTTFVITLSLVALCVTVHYELLYRLGTVVRSFNFGPRQGVVFGVMLALAAHTIEIYIFAGGYYYVLHTPELGSFLGESKMEDFFDCVYLSFVVYSTLGFGDIVPEGWVRFMVGMEAVTGLVQIAWTASFLYFQMETGWGHDGEPSQRSVPEHRGRRKN